MKVHLPPISSKKLLSATLKNESLLSPKKGYPNNTLSLLEKSIRANNVSSLLGDGRLATGNETEEDNLELEEKKEIESSLLTVRKRLDEVREAYEKKTQESMKMKREVDKMKADEENSTGGIENAHQKIEELKIALHYQKNKIEEVMHAQSTYGIMLDRLKKDKMADQLKVNHFQSEFNKKFHEYNQNIYELSKDTDLHTKTRSFEKEVQKQADSEKHKRNDNLSLLEQTLSAREEYNIKKELRTEHIQNVADDAANEVGDEQKRWNELLLTHKFVKFFLKSKIDRQVERYESAEKAFQKIKAATGLTDLNEITTRFLHREQKYSELLISIADLERKVDEARKENEQLNAKILELKDQSMMLDKLNEDRRVDKGATAEAQKELNTKIDAYKKANLTLESAHRWGVKTLKKLDKVQNVSMDNSNEDYPLEKMSEMFIKLIEGVKTNMAVIKEKEEQGLLTDIEKKYWQFSCINKRVPCKKYESKANDKLRK